MPRQTQELRLAIWDVDGTLVDSRRVIQTCMEAAFRETGLPPPDYEATRKIVGLGLYEGCAILAPPDTDRGRLEMLVMNYKNAFTLHRTSDGFHEPLYEGALGCSPGQSLMIGDAIHDIAMGRAAGVRSFGVSWGFGRADELQDAGAHEVHHDFCTLRESLNVFAAG